MNKLFAASVRSEDENGDEKVWVITQVASNKEEAHGKIYERLKRHHPKLTWSTPNILEISQTAIEACVTPNEAPKELKKIQQPSGLITGKLRELIDSNSWGLTFNASLKEFASEITKYLAEIVSAADNNFKVAQKGVELVGIAKTEIETLKLEKLTLGSEVERLQKQVEFLQKSNEIVNETNSSLRENLKNVESAYTSVFNDNKTIKDSINTVLEANEKLKVEATFLRSEQGELEETNKSLNDTIANYEIALSKRDEEVGTLKKRVLQLEEENTNIDNALENIRVTVNACFK